MAGKNRRKQQAAKQAKKDARNGKGNQPVVKDKFQEERTNSPIVAMTPKQKHYLALLNDPNIQIIIVEGLFGTGKSYCGAAVAGDKLRKNEITKIIVSRAYVQTGKTSGFRPGSTLDKLYPYVRNALDTISQRMGHGAYTQALGDGLTGKIEVQALEDIRGRSFDEKSFLIIEEAQQTEQEEMLSIVTRIGGDCKLILGGDESQRDTKGVSGLAWFKSFAKRHNLANVGYVNFDSPDDIVRSGIVADIARGLVIDSKNKNGEANGS